MLAKADMDKFISTLMEVGYSHMDAGDMYRSHFGSRYHTRADAVTQAFLLVLFDSLPAAFSRLRNLLPETRLRTVNTYAWFPCAPNMLQQWLLRIKVCTSLL